MPRLDRAITLNVAQPLIRGLAGRRGCETPERTLPILMYHSISDDREPGIAAYYRTVTSPGRFAEQMHWLRDHGYRGVSLRDGLDWLQPKSTNGKLASDVGPLPSKRPVALTFDDGFHDFYTAAFPVLQEYGFSATMYLPTSFIGESRQRFKPSTLDRKFSTFRDCLIWSEVRELQSAGIEFGSHTVTHPKLVNLTWPEIEAELTKSKSEIESRIGSPVQSFAYPYAFPQADLQFVKQFGNALRAAGYKDSVTTEIGRVRGTDDRLRLKRLPVNEADEELLFTAKLNGAYDWLKWPQRVVRSTKYLGGERR